MDADQLQRDLDFAFDQAVVHHAFTPYMRDYEVIVAIDRGVVPGSPYVRYLFRYCVEATVTSAVPPEVWRQSLDERLIRYETGVDLDGYVWGVNEQELYPGMSVVDPSERARRWGGELGIDFHEVRIEANAQTVTLVFSELVVSELEAGYTPFVTT